MNYQLNMPDSKVNLDFDANDDTLFTDAVRFCCTNVRGKAGEMARL
jgi:hypothetical protein